MSVRDNVTSFLEALAADQEARFACAACGELVYEGPVREGRHLMQKHRQEHHPELARIEVAQRKVRRSFSNKGTVPGVGNENAAARYAKAMAAARRDARLAKDGEAA